MQWRAGLPAALCADPGLRRDAHGRLMSGQVACGQECIEDALTKFAADVGRAMVFLKTLRRVRVQRWEAAADGDSPAVCLPLHQVGASPSSHSSL